MKNLITNQYIAAGLAIVSVIIGALIAFGYGTDAGWISIVVGGAVIILSELGFEGLIAKTQNILKDTADADNDNDNKDAD